MTIKLYNTASKQAEIFEPINPQEIRIYSCGPTVYSYAHIGNIRSFLFADLLQSVLKVVGNYPVKWVMNITDIDDKTIRDSNNPELWKSEMGTRCDDIKSNLKLYSSFYANEFLRDIQEMGIDSNDMFAIPRATEYIDAMQELIRKIYDNGYAYIVGNSVYFNVAKYRKDYLYGKLKKLDFDTMIDGVRIDADEYDREQASDFVLWKGYKEGEPFWEFNLDGNQLNGRPGWHLECSAMEYELLGLPFDIHTGGEDLKFPHHEDEIAQSTAGYGIDPTKYWCHNAFLEVEGSKMSKSAGNFFTLRDLKEKGLNLKDVRFAMLSAHYRSKYNFTFADVEAAAKGRGRVQEFIYSLFEESNGDVEPEIELLESDFYAELANDLHVPKALAVLFKFVNTFGKQSLSIASKKRLIDIFSNFNKIFKVWDINPKIEEKTEIPSEIIDLAQQRINAKTEKNWALADQIRNEIKERGYLLKDTKDGFELSKA